MYVNCNNMSTRYLVITHASDELMCSILITTNDARMVWCVKYACMWWRWSCMIVYCLCIKHPWLITNEILPAISGSFNSLCRVLCIFPLRYLFSISFLHLFSLGWRKPPWFKLHYQATLLFTQRFLVSTAPNSCLVSVRTLGTVTLHGFCYGHNFHVICGLTAQSRETFCDQVTSATCIGCMHIYITPLMWGEVQRHPCKFAFNLGVFPFHSPLLRESLFAFFSSTYWDASV